MSRTTQTCVTLAAILVASALPGQAHGGSVPFAQFAETTGRPVTFHNFNRQGFPGFFYSNATPITFNFLVPTNGGPTGPVNATLVINSSTRAKASLVGSTVDQPIDQVTSTIQITDTTAAHHNLLTLTFTGDIVGTGGATSANLTANNNPGKPDLVHYSSDYLTFGAGGSALISLPDLLGFNAPGLQIAPNGYLQSFTTDAQGSFSGNVTAVPAPPTLVMLAMGLMAPVSVMAVKRRQARVSA